MRVINYPIEYNRSENKNVFINKSGYKHKIDRGGIKMSSFKD